MPERAEDELTQEIEAIRKIVENDEALSDNGLVEVRRDQVVALLNSYDQHIELRRKYELLSRAVNEDSPDECEPGCDKWGHDGNCRNGDMAWALIKLKALAEGRGEQLEIAAIKIRALVSSLSNKSLDPGTQEELGAALQKILEGLEASGTRERKVSGNLEEQCEACGFDADNMALQILCRVFDDADRAMNEWRTFDKTKWLSSERALGGFIAGRLRATIRVAPKTEVKGVAQDGHPNDICAKCNHQRRQHKPERWCYGAALCTCAHFVLKTV